MPDDDERRVDRDGNVWYKKGNNWYEQGWDFWGQKNEHDSGEREDRPEGYNEKGEPIFRIKPAAETRRTSSSGDTAAAMGLFSLFAGLILAVIAFVIQAFKIFQEPNRTITASGKEPIIASFLSLITFGCGGHFYLGQRKKAILALIGCMILTPFVMPPLAAIDAYGTAVKLQQGRPVQEWEFSMGKESLPAYIVIGSILAIILISYSMSH